MYECGQDEWPSHWLHYQSSQKKLCSNCKDLINNEEFFKKINDYIEPKNSHSERYFTSCSNFQIARMVKLNISDKDVYEVCGIKNKNLYNKEVNVNFIKFIRSEKKFKLSDWSVFVV